MATINIGGTDVKRLGLGTNRITDSAQAREILRYAVERGVNFIDTAHLYTGGTSEQIIGDALAPYPPQLVVATKGGYDDGRPEVLRRQLEQSLSSLKTDHIKLYQLHRVDPRVEIEVSVGALGQFQDEGKIGQIGLSEVTVEQLKRAQAVATIVSVQNHYNLEERKHDPVVDYCEQQGIIFIPYFPLGGRGDGGHMTSRLQTLAAKYDATPRQLALAWLLKRSPVMLPIPGTLSKEHLDENLAALEIELSDADFAQI